MTMRVLSSCQHCSTVHRCLPAIEYLALSRRYLAFLWFAFHDKTGRFRNFLSYDREWQEEVGSEDSHGRALWALGTVLGISEDAGLRGAAGRLFEAAVSATLSFTSPRAWAFSVLGMQAYLDRFPGDRVIQGSRNILANRLLDIYERTHSDDMAVVREEPFVLQCEVVTGASSRRME